jgi:short-subunit dehydrogenase
MPDSMGKNIIIAGASSGLGKELAELYAAEGNRVGILGRREQLLQAVKQKFPEQISFKTADIQNENTEEILNDLFQELHPVDIFIITASVVNFNDLLLPEPEMETVKINVQGYMHCLYLAWQYFKKTGSGHIVGITSIAAARGNKHAPAYHASKAFQSIYLESLRLKAAREKNGICITEIIPGYIDTDMGKGDRLFWVISAKKAARLTQKAIAKKRGKAFVPGKWRWVYLIQKILPTFIYHRLVNASWKLKSKN